MAQTAVGTAVFRVIDALDHPHGGRILRLRLSRGEAPGLKDLRGGSFRATGPGGQEVSVTVGGFAVFGGRPSDDRLARTGRVDVHVAAESSDDPEAPEDPVFAIGRGWEMEGPLS